jgi:hypothetical protein
MWSLPVCGRCPATPVVITIEPPFRIFLLPYLTGPAPENVLKLTLRRSSLDLDRYPAQQKRRDLAAVLLQHDHVAVTVNSNVSKTHKSVLHARLRQVFRGAVIEGRMV